MSIKVRLFTLFLFLAVILVGTATFSFYENNTVSEEMDSLSDHSIPMAMDIMRLQTCVVQIQQWLTDISATRAAEGLDDGYDEAAKYYEEASEIIQRLQAEYGDNEVVQNLQADLDDFYKIGKQMANCYIYDGTEVGNGYMATFDPYAASMTDKVQTLLDEAVKSLDEQTDFTVEKIAGVTMNLLVTFGVILIVVAIYMFFLARGITKPISSVVNMLNQMSSGRGDLTKRLEVKSKDETGKLSLYFNLFIDNLHEMISSMVASIDGLESSTIQVTVAMDNSNEDVSEINVNIERITKSVNEVAHLVHEISDSAETMSKGMYVTVENISTSTDKSVIIQKNAHAGTKNIEALSNLMNSVASNTNVVYTSVESLEQSSKEIEKIVEMVRDIADQTNLLALNANIEAARAGEHGRGFAIVASEVSKLAQDSINAVDKISDIIGDIRIKSKTSFDSISEGKELVVQASEKADETSVQFTEISTDIDLISGLMKEALVLVKEQSDLSDVILESVHSIDENATSTADNLKQINSAMEEQVATIEEVAASLEEVSCMSTELKAQTSQFKLKEQ